MEKSEKVLFLANIVLVGFAINVIFYYFLGFYLNMPYPLNTFLDSPFIAFSDFTETLSAAKTFAPFANPDSWINYFPFAYILLFPLSFIKNQLIAYILFLLGFLTAFIPLNVYFLNCKNLTKLINFQNISIISCLSYPLLYLIDRGNFDMFLFVLFAGFIYSFKSEKFLLSSVVLAVINAIKPFTLLFLILFLIKKKYKEFFLSLIISTLLVISGFMILNGNFFDQISVFIKNLMLFKFAYVYSTGEAQLTNHSSSLFIALKLMFCIYNKFFSTTLLEKIYSFLSLSIGAITLFFIWREKYFWKQITLLTLIMLLLPYVIVDYKLLFLLVPIWLFINENEKSNFDILYTALFGLLMINKSLTFFGVNFQIFINPVIMIIFIGLIIFEQLKQKQDKQEI